MNILVFDAGGSIGALVRAGLAGCGHRISLESDGGDARLKLETALFDALVVGPGGMIEELASYVEAEWPAMPVVLAGMPQEAPPAGQVAAVLAAPLCVERLRAAVRKIENRLAADARKTYDMPVDVIAGEQRLACRVVRFVRGSVLIEVGAQAGEGLPSEAFPGRPAREATAKEGEVACEERSLAITRGSVRVEGDVAFRDRGLIAVRMAPESLSQLALSGVEGLEVGDAKGIDREPDRGGVSDLQA